MFSRPMRFLASAAGTGLWFAQPQTVIALFIIRHKVHGWILIIMRIFFCIPHRPKACPKGQRRGGIWFHAPHFFTY